MSTNDYWLDRISTLQAAIDETIDGLADTPQVPDRDNFKQLLINLRDFGDRQFHFFYDAMKKGVKAPKGFSQENALAVTLDQIGFDLNAIAQCAWQRRFDPDFHAALIKGDQIVEEALKPGVDLLPQNMVGLTYLQKSPNVRVIPYANVALIGIPYSILNFSSSRGLPVTRDYLATPHEVGHFVFWRGRLPGTEAAPSKDLSARYGSWPLRRALGALTKGAPSWLRKWTEETFADVYGGRVGGPIMAVDFQDLEDERCTADGFYNDDGDHPVPVLRPEIYAKTLEAMSGFEAFGDRTRGRWTDKALNKARNVIDAKFKPTASNKPIQRSDLPLMRFKSSSGRFIKVKDGQAQLHALVEGMNELLPNLPTADLFAVLPTRFPSGDFADQLFHEFDGRVTDLPTTRQGRTTGSGEAVIVNEDWLNKWDTWRGQLLEDTKRVSGKPRLSQADEWLAIVLASGWTTEEPQGQPPI